MKEKKRHPHGCKIFMWLPRNWTYSLNDLRLTDRQTLCSITPHTRLGAQHGAAVATRHWSVMDLLIFWSILGIWTYWISKNMYPFEAPLVGAACTFKEDQHGFPRGINVFVLCIQPVPEKMRREMVVNTNWNPEWLSQDSF